MSVFLVAYEFFALILVTNSKVPLLKKAHVQAHLMFGSGDLKDSEKKVVR